jgi:hypothetical protein
LERYQDAWHPDRTDPGDRDCAPRWQLIEPHVPVSGVMLDIGSNLGYYGLRAVDRQSGIAVVSIEADPSIAERQAGLIRRLDTDRICLLEGSLSASVLRSWRETCDWFDITLALSILHWLDDPADAVASLASMSGVLIAEVPDAGDRGACGQERIAAWGDNPVRWFAETTGRRATLLGRMTRHTSEVPSHIVMVDGPVERLAPRPYWGADYERAGREPYRIHSDGQAVHLTIRGSEVAYVPGVNLVNLMHVGRLVHPAPATFLAQARSAFETEPGHGDPFPHNILWTPAGLRLIDGDDLRTENPHEAGFRSLVENVTNWAAPRSTASFGYVRERTGIVRRVRHIAGSVLRPALGDRRVNAIKARLGIPTGR